MDKSAALFRASNLIALDYPFDAALVSALSLCDEAVVVLGVCYDETRDWVYALQQQHGAERVIVREQDWEFDRMWQERCWDWGAEMTDAEWLMYHDADEAVHEDDVVAILEVMASPDVKLISFPYAHLYGTPAFRYVGPKFYPRNTRLGRRSAGFRMRNWCSDANPTHAACQMVYGPTERNAHACRSGEITLLETPIYHYGWCRDARAMAMSTVKHRAWYDDGGGLEDGRLLDVEPYPFRLTDKLAAGEVVQYSGSHPASVASWRADHAATWARLERNATIPYPTKMEIQDQIHGIAYIPDHEIAALCRYVEDAHLPVEIGAGYGATVIIMLWRSQAPLVVSIDPFVTDGVTHWHSTRAITSANVEKLTGDAYGRWVLCEDYSYNVAPNWQLGQIDFLLLDGDHRYEQVRRDWEDWLPLMQPGGVILLHDSRRLPDPQGKWDGRFNRGWPGPTRLAQEARQDPRVTLIEEIGSLTIWRVS